MYLQGFVTSLLFVSLAFGVLSLPASPVDNEPKSIMETDYCIIPAPFWEMTLVISPSKCKNESIEEIQSALDMLNKYNLTMIPSERLDAIDLHKNVIRSRLLDRIKFDSKRISKRSPPNKEEREPLWNYFPFNIGYPVLEVFDWKYY